ncbi:MAG: alpha-mannosidase [Clostridia bacterium]|nr:alpha-mannosidase [Clostridia bacterium]
MFFTLEKCRARIEALSPFRARNTTQALAMYACPCPAEPVAPPLPGEEAPWTPVRLGDEWRGRDTYLWLKCRVSCPDAPAGALIGVFDFGRTGNCNCSGFESQLFVDGAAFQGVDTHHGEVFFPEDWKGTERTLLFRIWSGLEGGGEPMEQVHRFSRAYTAILDADTDYLYYAGRMLLDTIGLLDERDTLRAQLLALIDRAVNKLDGRDAGSEDHYASIACAAQCLREGLAGIGGKLPVEVIALGNTHIDVAWLWRYKHTRAKSARSFSTALRLMEQYPEYTFLMSQPQLYEFIREDFPDIYEGIRRRVREGRWEIEGGMWIEADCNIPGGESLTRQFLLGKAFARREFGVDMHLLWLPDVFGYSWALPQIMKKSGIDTFITTKISWNEMNQMPWDTFMWTGIDGSRVLTHFITTPAASEEQGSWYYTYNGEMLPSSVSGIWNNYRNKGLTDELLLAYGYGDGGGGVNREELEQRRILDAMPGLPGVKTGRATDYFRRLHARVEAHEGFVPEWDGELYLENHRGTYTSHAANKRMNRRLEFLYRDAEWLSVLAGLRGGYDAEAARDALTEGWKIILLNQFHDVIPGSAIREVYEDSMALYDRARETAQGVIGTALEAVRSGDEGFSLINSAPWDYEGPVQLPLKAGESVLDEAGSPCPADGGDGCVRAWVRVPAMSAVPLRTCPASGAPERAFDWRDNTLQTPFYTVSFDPIGRIGRLYDKRHGREVLPEGRCANRFVFFDDEPLICDAWNINLFYTEKPHPVETLEAFRVETGDLSFTVHCAWRYRSTAIAQDITFYSGSPRIDFDTRVDMHEQHQLLKVEFPVNVRTTFATYDIQYGSVKRPNHWNTSWDMARFETVMHKWMDLSDSDWGVSLINDCKYGADVHGQTMRMTLIKTATYPDPTQDQGEHRFRYALYPHSGDASHCDVEREAFFLNDPVRVVPGSIRLPSFLSLSTGTIAVDAVKTSEAGGEIVVRLHEFAGAATACALTPGFNVACFAESDLMETPQTAFKPLDGPIELRFTPFEIKTLLFRSDG